MTHGPEEPQLVADNAATETTAHVKQTVKLRDGLHALRAESIVQVIALELMR